MRQEPARRGWSRTPRSTPAATRRGTRSVRRSSAGPAAGARDGRWTTWYPDGAFRSETTWRAGVQHGARREIARDGRIVELEMIDGAAAGLRSLPAGAPMPEWEAGKRVDGSRYRGHVAPGAPSGLGP